MASIGLPCTNDSYPHCRAHAVIALHLLSEAGLGLTLAFFQARSCSSRYRLRKLAENMLD